MRVTLAMNRKKIMACMGGVLRRCVVHGIAWRVTEKALRENGFWMCICIGP